MTGISVPVCPEPDDGGSGDSTLSSSPLGQRDGRQSLNKEANYERLC